MHGVEHPGGRPPPTARADPAAVTAQNSGDFLALIFEHGDKERPEYAIEATYFAF